MATIAATSLAEYLYFPNIAAFDARSPDSHVDPTTLPVQVALVTPGTAPVDADWVDAEWESTTVARVLVGTSTDLVVVAGHEYDAWLTVIGAVEQPQALVGQVIAY